MKKFVDWIEYCAQVQNHPVVGGIMLLGACFAALLLVLLGKNLA